MSSQLRLACLLKIALAAGSNGRLQRRKKQDRSADPSVRWRGFSWACNAQVALRAFKGKLLLVQYNMFWHDKREAIHLGHAPCCSMS